MSRFAVLPVALILLLTAALPVAAAAPVQSTTTGTFTLADAIFAQWSLAGVGTAVDMNARLVADPQLAQVNRFGSDFFDLAAGPAFAIQAGFAILFLA